MSTYDQLGRPLNKRDGLFLRRNTRSLDEDLGIEVKCALLKASPSVVGIITFNVPAEMTRFLKGHRMMKTFEDKVFMGSGIVVECEGSMDGKFYYVVLTTSNMFTRINDIQPKDIKVQVYMLDKTLCVGELIVVDFHYNIAAVRIASSTPLKVATVKELDDVITIPSAITSESRNFLRRHSDRLKVRPGEVACALGRCPFGDIMITSGCLSVKCPRLDCNELYSLTVQHQGDCGGPVVNRHGEIIGMMMADEYFMPSNVVNRWWKSYKDHGELCQLRLEVAVANLYAACVPFLEQLLHEFPTISSGVFVTKVPKNSEAYRCGLRRDDVIVRCDGTSVGSTLELYEKMWVKAGASMELGVIRVRSGKSLNLMVTIDKVKPENFYRWPIPDWTSLPVYDSEAEMEE